jgi:hypothetical protein
MAGQGGASRAKPRLASAASAKLAALDANGDGCVDDNEILTAVEELVQEERSSRHLWRIAVALLVALLVVVGATAGCVYAIVNLTKQLKVRFQARDDDSLRT